MNALTSTGNLATFTERHIPRGEYQIYLHDYAGAEPAFVLMDGFPDNLGIYDRLAPLFAEAGHRIVAFDFLGYGGSDKPSGYPYTTKSPEGDLQAVVAALELDQVVPVGHDASGPTAIDWSLDHEDRVAALALLNCYYGAAPTLKFPEFISLFADSAHRALAMAFISDPAQFSWLLQSQARQFLRDAPQPIQEAAGRVLVPVAIDTSYRKTRETLERHLTSLREN
ncbi:MAG: alpha/beta fold hydrolase [Terriglobia bacterium]